MGKIALLDQSTINQIAAGEVIERPAAVVKELVENAIDAGASAVTVEIKEGGISFIRITDNGVGILEEDIPLVFLRHSTSKIRSATDLLTVTSLGFRGEALSSIAAIAQVELVTKTAESFTGIRYLISGGEEKSLEQIGCPNGTTFLIRNLFYNTPARRKFLKSPVTEAGYIQDIMERLVVSHPNVSFKFINNNQVKLHTSGNTNLKDILYHVYGRDIITHLEYVEASCTDIKIQGFIAKPIVTRGNRNYENYFINGRYIKSGLIYKAIEEAYKPYIMTHRYPFTSLHIDINSELIDVNVHPAKLEIRFKNSDDLYNLIYNTVKAAIEGKELIPKVTLTEEKDIITIEQKIPEPFEVNRIKNSTTVESANVPKNDTKNDYSTNSFVNNNYSQRFSSSRTYDVKKVDKELDDIFGVNKDVNVIKSEGELEAIKNTEIGSLEHVISNASNLVHETITYEESVKKEESLQKLVKPEQLSFLSEKAVISHRIIGQVFKTFWLVEYGDAMFMIDQHAAHEKVMYEKIMSTLKDREISSQLLEPPIIMSFSMREEEALTNNMKLFHKLGFEIEEFGGNEYAIRGVPNDFYGLNVKEVFTELIDGLVEDGYSGTPEIVLEKMASMSCKAAVKGNTILSYEEAKVLIDMLLTLDNPYHCPHGRPTIISMSKYEMEKKFKRIV
jgi:DNA mismatch repair protein MutL